MIEALTVEAFQNHKKSLPHWKELFQRTEIRQIAINDHLTLQTLIDAQLFLHREVVEQVSQKAEKIWSLEKKMKEVEDRTKEIQLQTMAFKQTGTTVLK